MGVLSLRIYSWMSACGVSVCQYVRIHWEAHAVVCMYIARRGQAFVAYPHEGAMRRPELWDKRERHYSHVFFVSIRLS